MLLLSLKTNVKSGTYPALKYLEVMGSSAGGDDFVEFRQKAHIAR